MSITQTTQPNPTASERIRIARAAHESHQPSKDSNFWLFIGTVALIASLGVKGYEHVTAAHPHTVTEIVQPSEAPWTIAQRAEAEHGSHPDQFNVAQEADRIADENGLPLHAGQKIEVRVK